MNQRRCYVSASCLLIVVGICIQWWSWTLSSSLRNNSLRMSVKQATQILVSRPFSKISIFRFFRWKAKKGLGTRIHSSQFSITLTLAITKMPKTLGHVTNHSQEVRCIGVPVYHSCNFSANVGLGVFIDFFQLQTYKTKTIRWSRSSLTKCSMVDRLLF